MKTSSAQFDLMVTFMEQHGDLSKPSSNARGRISTLTRWEELTQLLNSDGSGDSKTSDKWKKVWSDFKNNTKKKAARLHRAASGTGGGPAVFAKLTYLEQRVLNLIGVQVATGLQVEEAGLSQVIDMQPNLSVGNDPSLVPQEPSQSVELSPHELVSPQSASPVPPQVSRAISSPPNIFTEEEIQPSQPSSFQYEPGPSIEAQTRAQTHFEETGLHTPTRPTSHAHVVRPHTEPTNSGQTTPRRARLLRPRGSPRRRSRLTHTDQAAENFLRAEEFWRKFKIEQHKDYMSMRREQNRIRDSEIRIRDSEILQNSETQRQWQFIALRVVNMLDKLVDKFCKD